MEQSKVRKRKYCIEKAIELLKGTDVTGTSPESKLIKTAIAIEQYLETGKDPTKKSK